MAEEYYYRYSFDLKDGLITEDTVDKNGISHMRAFGLEIPFEFDDFVDVWKEMCRPIFEGPGDEEILCCKYFREAYSLGERKLVVDIEHNPLKHTYPAKYTRITILMYEDEVRKVPRVTVTLSDNSHNREGKNNRFE